VKSEVHKTKASSNGRSERPRSREVLRRRSGRLRAQGGVRVLGAFARSGRAAKGAMLLFVVFVLLASRPAQADPVLGKIVELRQPDGSMIQTRVWGDEFYRVVESLDGYTLVRDPASRRMCYAVLSADANDLVSTGVSASKPLPAQMQIEQHLRIRKQAAAARLEAARARLAPAQSGSDSTLQAASSPATTGNVKGICLLVDFADEPQQIPPSDVNDFCNKQGYNGNGNNGSVRDYFYDVSDGHLTYTNYVTPVYYRARYNKAYYDDPSATEGTRARDLVLEALLWLDAQGFDFSQYDSNGDGIIDGISCLYAGSRTADGGLWPHSWVVTFSADGVSAYRYQISDLGTAPHLGTFCHESGHMVCDWPDLYDRDWNGQQYDSTAIGDYCLMCYGSRFDNNPPEPCAYLKALAGWATVTTLTVPQTGLTVEAGKNSFFKFQHPKLSNEYYLVENREQSGRDAHLPDSGLAIWHIDENGNNDNQQMTPASHYQVTLVQADGKWDMEHDRNSGDETDLFDTLTLTEFNPFTDPCSSWWAGGPSALSLKNISASGETMSFDFGLDESPPLGRDGVFGIMSGDSATIRVHGMDDFFPNPPGDLAYVVSSLPEHGTLEDPAAGPITEAGTALADFGNVVIYHPEDGYLGIDAFGFKAYDGGSVPSGGYSDEAVVSIRISQPIYVDDDAGNDPSPGDPLSSDPLEDGSAEHPFDAIQKAIDFAISSESIIVRSGTYTGRGNHDIDFSGKSVKIHSEDGPATCIIDCQHVGQGFTFHSGEDADALLEGLTITNGQNFAGGAISCQSGSSPTITNCTFSNNLAMFSGGAMYNDESSPAVTRCTFSGNSAMWGGGMSNNYGSNPSMTDCTFTQNRATDWAGGMENFALCFPIITGCTFSGNVAAGDGGGIYDLAGIATFENCTFSDNSAANGGGMDVEGSFPILTGCTFSANRATENGGGMCNLDSEPNVTNCLFNANVSQQAGGVMYNADSNTVLTNCTLADNLASAGSGGVQNSGSSHLILTNCIVWGNGRMQIDPAESVTASYTDCTVEGRLPLPGVGNFDFDPYFADPANGDYHLKSQAGRWDPVGQTWVVDDVTSLCIDAGDPASPFDLEPAPNGGRINIGAYGGTAEASMSPQP
jgi:M6 family metalloprotease-like protein